MFNGLADLFFSPRALIVAMWFLLALLVLLICVIMTWPFTSPPLQNFFNGFSPQFGNLLRGHQIF